MYRSTSTADRGASKNQVRTVGALARRPTSSNPARARLPKTTQNPRAGSVAPQEPGSDAYSSEPTGDTKTPALGPASLLVQGAAVRQVKPPPPSRRDFVPIRLCSSASPLFWSLSWHGDETCGPADWPRSTRELSSANRATTHSKSPSDHLVAR